MRVCEKTSVTTKKGTAREKGQHRTNKNSSASLGGILSKSCVILLTANLQHMSPYVATCSYVL
jgi:hypothetical protein